MSGLYQQDFVERLRVGAGSVLGEWGLSERSELTLINLSENATFRADDPERAAPVIVRVHRPDYHTEAEIRSELAWITALRGDGIVRTPAIVPTGSGGQIVRFEDGDIVRRAVAFEFLPGTEPDPDADLTASFETLGAINARLHLHSRSWPLPDGFVRKTWNFDTAFGRAPLWGDWRQALGLTPDGTMLLQRLADQLACRLAAYGTGPDRFGLVHADLRLANLLDEDGALSVIDFDDCGFSWLFYDFAAAISFLETSPTVPALLEAWIRGYRGVAPLGDEHIDMMPTFILYRRLLLTAWIASHSETDTAEWAGHESYTDGTCELAERYLSESMTVPAMPPSPMRAVGS